MNDKARIAVKLAVVILLAGVLAAKFAWPQVTGNRQGAAQSPTEIKVTHENKPPDNSPSEGQEVPQLPEMNANLGQPDSATPPLTLQSTTGESLPQWILFGAGWCPACKELEKTIKQVMPEFQGKIKLVEVDVDSASNREMVQQYNITYIPATFLYDQHGDLFYQQVGAIPADELRARLQALLEVK